MIVHNFDPFFVDLGFFQIRWYSLAYVIGIMAGWTYANKIIKYISQKDNVTLIKPGYFDDLILYIILGIIIGGRLGYILLYNLKYYSSNFFEIFKIWEGGMSFHGGLLGVIISTIIFSKIRKSNFFSYADIICCVAPIGIFLGRLANFINGELYGKITVLPWAVVFPNAGDLSRHPSQIYEALLEGLALFILINYLALKKKLILKNGYISGLFLVYYSIFRLFSENFREPDVHIGYFLNYFSLGSLLSFITLCLGLLIILFLRKNEPIN